MRSGRGDPGPGGLRSGGLGDHGHLDPAAQPDQPDRPDVARGVPHLGGRPRGGSPRPYDGPDPGPAAVEVLRARHRHRRQTVHGHQRPQRRTGATARQRRGPQPDDAAVGQWLRHPMAGGVGARPTRSDHRRDRSVRRPAHRPVTGLVAGRHRGGGAGRGRDRGLRGGAPQPAAIDRGRTNRRGDRGGPTGSPGSRTGSRGPRWADFRWRSTECSPKFSKRWHPRSLRPKRPAAQRNGCDGSSPTPATNCAPR